MCGGRTSDAKILLESSRSFPAAELQGDCQAYIRMVEPRKQVHHPYNGRLPGGGNAPEQLDPEATKPPWWPAGVTHREPDHLLKEGMSP